MNIQNGESIATRIASFEAASSGMVQKLTSYIVNACDKHLLAEKFSPV